MFDIRHHAFRIDVRAHARTHASTRPAIRKQASTNHPARNTSVSAAAYPLEDPARCDTLSLSTGTILFYTLPPSPTFCSSISISLALALTLSLFLARRCGIAPARPRPVCDGRRSGPSRPSPPLSNVCYLYYLYHPRRFATAARQAGGGSGDNDHGVIVIVRSVSTGTGAVGCGRSAACA